MQTFNFFFALETDDEEALQVVVQTVSGSGKPRVRKHRRSTGSGDEELSEEELAAKLLPGIKFLLLFFLLT